MLRILIIAPTMYFSDRGCHIRIYEQARVLREMGHRPTIITYHSGNDIGSSHVNRIIRTPWYDKLVAGPSLHFLYMDALLFLKCLEYTHSQKVDIIHAHLHEGAFIAGLLLKTRTCANIKYVFDAQGSLTGEMTAHGFLRGKGVARKFWRRLEHDIDNNAHFTITSSDHLRNTMLKDFGVSPNRIMTISDGVDPDKFKPRNKYTLHENYFLDLRSELGIPNDRLVVVYLGGMDRHKGINYLIESIPGVLESNKKIHFLLMGYPGEESIRERIVEMGVGGNVSITGKIPYAEAPRYLSVGDMAVAPKLLEWGEANGKLFNYMGCGLPVVAFDHPTNREIMGKAGVYAEMGSTASLTEKILELAGNRGKRRDLGLRLRRLAKDQYTWEKTGERIEKVYRALMNE
ncbi:MAG: glycosyltransferase family 4 protein [Candidatus Thermoplasmatota archaeon]|jgi:glycosyltransferase involved in cell wall biosynthesis|nr:glycosyltransferase family 4 protein [Candidatus Thermoplasmatota archaeon]